MYRVKEILHHEQSLFQVSHLCREGGSAKENSSEGHSSSSSVCGQLLTNQDVLVFASETYGHVLVLDGAIQCTERDEFS